VHLPPQEVEVLGGRGRPRDLDVVFGAQGQEAFDPGAGVLGALTLEAVREEQDQSAGLAPLVLGGHDELVDHDLCLVDEVAELRLPQHQRVLRHHGEAVFEAQRGELVQR